MDNKKDESKYILTITGTGISVKRQILESVARRILNLVMDGNGFDGREAHETHDESGHMVGEGNHENGPTAKAFMASKRPASDIERITCLAYYLAHYRSITSFKTIELTKLNTDAAQPKLSNPAASARNAVGQDYLSLAGGGRKQITVRGEALVSALPDRSKVKDALAANALRHHHRKSKRTPKKAK